VVGTRVAVTHDCYLHDKIFHTRESNRQHFPWDLDISPPSSGSLRSSPTKFCLNLMCSLISPMLQTWIYTTLFPLSPFFWLYILITFYPEVVEVFPPKLLEICLWQWEGCSLSNVNNENFFVHTKFTSIDVHVEGNYPVPHIMSHTPCPIDLILKCLFYICCSTYLVEHILTCRSRWAIIYIYRV